MPAKILNPTKHFWRNVERDKGKGCWNWKRCVQSDGYGTVRFWGRTDLAHRVAYQLKHGVRIPNTIHVLHKCDNPKCCRPSHLFTGTHSDNMRDMWAKGRHVRLNGALNGRAILTEEKVKEIRLKHSLGMRQIDLAKEYGVNQTNISWIVLRKSWKNI